MNLHRETARVHQSEFSRRQEHGSLKSGEDIITRIEEDVLAR